MRLLKLLNLLVLALILSAGVHYKILVVKSDYPDLQDFQTHIIQFLDASAFKYDVVQPGEGFTYSSLVSGDALNYSTVILFARASELSEEEKNALKKASGKGISLVSFSDAVGESPFYRELFGITHEGAWEEAENIRIRSGLGFLTHGLEGEKLKPSLIREIKVHHSCRIIAASGASVPVVYGYPYNKGINYLFNLDKNSPAWWWSEYSTSLKDPRLSLLRRVIIENSGLGFVYYDLSYTVILRVDDFLQHRHVWEEPTMQDLYPIVERRFSRQELNEIGDVFEKHGAHVTFLVVPGFVDPGPSKGLLLINGKTPAVRGCGLVFDAKDVTFQVTTGWNAGDTYDYRPEYKGLLDLQKRGIIDIQEHGFTHLNWRRDLWCADPNRGYDFFKWEREFVDLVNHEPVPADVQENILYQGYIRIKNWFGHEPIALIPPGHAHDETTLELAHEFGIKLFSVSWLGIWKDWGYDKNLQIRSLFINYHYWSPPPTLRWHIAASPYLLYFHDWDLILGGKEWLDEVLTQWEKAYNIKHYISLGQFAGYYFSSLEATREGNRFSITVDLTGSGGPHDLPQDRFFSSHPLVLKIHLPGDLWRAQYYMRGFAEAYSSSPSVKRVYMRDGEIMVEFKPFGRAAKKKAEVLFIEGRR